MVSLLRNAPVFTNSRSLFCNSSTPMLFFADSKCTFSICPLSSVISFSERESILLATIIRGFCGYLFFIFSISKSTLLRSLPLGEMP